MEPESSVAEELRRQRFTIQVLLLVIIGLAMAVGLVLFRQVSVIGRQATDSQMFIWEYQTNDVPRMNSFLANLEVFSKTNPDLHPILVKYNLIAPTTNATGAPARSAPGTKTAPAPGPKK
jgi:hypothetical protein